jgi:hypothetical protein
MKVNPRLWIEKFFPVSVGIVTLAILLIARVEVMEIFAKNNLNGTSLFSSVFDWASIQTGFMFGVYGFVVGKSDGFIAEVKSTKAMERFVRYTWTATMIGFVLTLLSMPLIVVGPSIQSASLWLYCIISAWFALFLWGFTAFLRVAYIFGIVVRPKTPQIIPG